MKFDIIYNSYWIRTTIWYPRKFSIHPTTESFLEVLGKNKLHFATIEETMKYIDSIKE